jgi:hypothetical protein
MKYCNYFNREPNELESNGLKENEIGSGRIRIRVKYLAANGMKKDLLISTVHLTFIDVRV